MITSKGSTTSEPVAPTMQSRERCAARRVHREPRVVCVAPRRAVVEAEHHDDLRHARCRGVSGGAHGARSALGGVRAVRGSGEDVAELRLRQPEVELAQRPLELGVLDRARVVCKGW